MTEPARYTCYRAAGPIAVDGKLDEPSWQLAPKSAPFVDIVTGEPAWFDTRVAILWDDEHLYFGFWVEETDVWGTMTKRDSKIWEENDVEVFIAGRDAYYEFELNALNTVYEVFWIWKDIHQPGGRYWGRPEFDPRTQRTMVLDGVGGHVHERGERWGFLDWDYPGLRTAVHVDGVVNGRTNTDRGWTVELALPWRGLVDLADGRALPPKDGDVWRMDCSRFEKIGRGREVLDPCVGWTWNRHGHYDSHIPEVFPYVTFSDQRVDEVWLFSYGTLRQLDVQLAIFGRALEGRADVLPGYAVSPLEITDSDVIATSGTAHHTIVRETGDPLDEVPGIVYGISHADLAAADAYEVADCKRVSVRLGSGIDAFVYVDARLP